MNYESLNELTLRDKLSEWYQSPLGETVYAEEMSKLEEILPRIFGYHILQFGYCAELNYLKASRISNKTILFLENSEFKKDIKKSKKIRSFGNIILKKTIQELNREIYNEI